MIDGHILEWFKTVVLAFVTLFPIVNPVGDAPIFLSLTREYPQSVQNVLSRKVALYGFLLLASSLMLGTEILAFFGISISVVEMAGGLVLANTGWTLLNQGSTDTDSGAAQKETLQTAMQEAFYPLTLPLTVGPGCISVAITIGAHLKGKLGSGLYVAALLGMALVCILVWFCYSRASRLEKILGSTGTSVVIRLSSFILVAIGFQIAWNGFSTSWEALSRSLHG